MTLRIAALTLSTLLALAGPADAQDKSIIGQDTIIPGSGPNTATAGPVGSGLMLAPNANDAAARKGLKPATVMASKIVGMEVRNAAGDSIGTVDDLIIDGGGGLKAVVLEVGKFYGLRSRRIAVGPSALVLRPGGQAFAGVLNLSKDTLAAAPTFKPEEVLTPP